MENFVILAAVAVTLIVCVLMVGLFRAERRAPLRLPQEEAWADDEAGTVRKLTPHARARSIARRSSSMSRLSTRRFSMTVAP